MLLHLQPSNSSQQVSKSTGLDFSQFKRDFCAFALVDHIHTALEASDRPALHTILSMIEHLCVQFRQIQDELITSG